MIPASLLYDPVLRIPTPDRVENSAHTFDTCTESTYSDLVLFSISISLAWRLHGLALETELDSTECAVDNSFIGVSMLNLTLVCCTNGGASVLTFLSGGSNGTSNASS